MLRVLLLLDVFFLTCVTCRACHVGCSCFRTTVRCQKMGLTSMPLVSNKTTTLDLRQNRIRSIPRGYFDGFSDLNTLMLDRNRIDYLEPDVFRGLKNLRFLYLYKNDIPSLHPGMFRGMRLLEQLYLYNNNITTLREGVFNDLRNLKRLHLQNNQIETIPAGVFKNLTSLLHLRLEGNNLVCDCKLGWIRNLAFSIKNAIVKCYLPVHLRGRSVLSIPPQDFRCGEPVIVKPPSNIDVLMGYPVTLLCRATGDPKPEIEWRHNNVELVASNRMHILEDGSLRILQTLADDEGMYQCKALNSRGSVTAVARITYINGSYNRAPVLTTVPPASAVVKVSGSIVLPCFAVGSPKPDISWFKGNRKITSDDRHYIVLKRSTSSDLKIVDAVVEDEGSYLCRAWNNKGFVSAATKLSVHEAPLIVIAPSDTALAIGQNAQLQCRASGRPTPTITWSHDGHPIPRDSRQKLLASGDLLIRDLEQTDAGLYTCQALNEVAKVSSRSAKLTIRNRSPPTFLQRPADAIAVEGRTVKLDCRTSSGPRITWTLDNHQVAVGGRISVNDVGALIISSVRKSDEGIYSCFASNQDGHISASAKLTVKGATDKFAGDPYVTDTVAEAEREINEAIAENIAKLTNSNSPGGLRKLLRFPSETALTIAKATEFLEAFVKLIQDKVVFNLTDSEISVVNLLSPYQLEAIANMSGCMLYREHDMCSNFCYHKRYRTFDGTCNNLQHRLWGAAVTPLKRALEPIYENRLNSPVGWSQSQQVSDGKAFGPKYPSPRVVSTEIISTHRVTADPRYTHMLMQFGQFLDHDVTHSPTSPSARCDDHCNTTQFCYPIPIPPEDRRIRGEKKCMSFSRSVAMCGTGATSVFFESVSSREQINQITAYIDGSMVYGSSSSQALKLRNATAGKGLLKQGLEVVPGKHLLPFNEDEFVDCLRPLNAKNEEQVPCFLAGDRRANEQVALTALHTIWMREHNRIATTLSELNPHWDDDRLFQEARKIVGAELQHITYTEFLPKVLGDESMKSLSAYTSYDPDQDASILNSFATGAYRFGHGLIHPVVRRLNASFQSIPEGDLSLRHAFFAPYRIVHEGGIDPLLRGMVASSGKLNSPSEVINTELTEHLFSMAHEVAFDLGALNIQRGRDHGLPMYTSWREYCGLSVPVGFDDLDGVISNRLIRKKLKKLYGKPANIDMWVGGLVEDPLPHGRVGPLFACIIAEQFKRTRSGDRFWYERASVFEPAQLAEIKKTTLARVICQNSDSIDRIQRDAFLVVNDESEYQSCSSLPQIDLRHWTDCSTKTYMCVSESGCLASKTSKESQQRVSKRSSETVMYQGSSHVEVDSLLGMLGQSLKPVSVLEDQTRTLTNKTAEMERTIEAMADAIIVLQDTVAGLKAKLEEKEKCHLEGKIYNNNQSWNSDECTQCQCQDGQVTCRQEECEQLDCDDQLRVEGQCCSVCP